MNPLIIIEYIRQHKLTKEEFCKFCEINIETLDDMIYFDKYNNETLEKISDKTNIGYYQFFTR